MRRIIPFVMINVGIPTPFLAKMKFRMANAIKKIHEVIFTLAIVLIHEIFNPNAAIKVMMLSIPATIGMREPNSEPSTVLIKYAVNALIAIATNVFTKSSFIINR